MLDHEVAKILEKLDKSKLFSLSICNCEIGKESLKQLNEIIQFLV
jgi:hypothetical protein